MTTLVVGASGATGRLLVEQLLNRGQNVKVIVRSPDKLPEVLKNHDHLSVIQRKRPGPQRRRDGPARQWV